MLPTVLNLVTEIQATSPIAHLKRL